MPGGWSSAWARLRGRGREDAAGFPRRSPLASWGQHLALDAREDVLYWARSRPGRSGLRLLEWGRVPVPEGDREDVLQAIARLPWVRFAYVEVPIRSPDLRHKRVSLPPMTPAQAYRVGRRRATEFLREQPESCLGSFMRVRHKGAHPLWLVAIPEQAARLFFTRWETLGYDVHRMSSESLALGNLARLLPSTEQGSLTAIFDVQPDAGDCVICDDQGWLFNRVIPMRQARGGEPNAGGIANLADKPEGLSAAQLDRVSTELMRTFQYVERELRLGRVTRVAVAGELADLEGLAAHLNASLDGETRVIGEWVREGPGARMDAAAARAVGLAMAPDARGCSLLPGEAKARHRARRAGLQLKAGLGLASVLAGLWLGLWGLDLVAASRSIRFMADEMGSNEQRLEIIADTARSRERARDLDAMLSRVRRPEPPWHAYYEVLARSTPPDVALEELSIARSAQGWTTQLALEARGASVATAAEGVTELRDALQRAPFLAGVTAARDRARQTVQEEEGSKVFFRMSGQVGVLLDAPAVAPAESTDAD